MSITAALGRECHKAFVGYVEAVADVDCAGAFADKGTYERGQDVVGHGAVVGGEVEIVAEVRGVG